MASRLKLVKRLRPVWRLTSPLNYWRIAHPEKTKYDRYYPALFAVVVTAGYLLLPVRPVLLGDGGILSSVRELLTLLIPFSVAALAAVATAHREGLDDRTAGDMLNLNGEALTRRRFICFLFGYLAWICLALFLAIIVGEAVAPAFRAVAPNLLEMLRPFLFGVFAFFLGHMLVTTLWALFYFTDRMNR